MPEYQDDSPVRPDAFSEKFFGRKNPIVDDILGFWFDESAAMPGGADGD